MSMTYSTYHEAQNQWYEFYDENFDMTIAFKFRFFHDRENKNPHDRAEVYKAYVKFGDEIIRSVTVTQKQ